MATKSKLRTRPPSEVGSSLNGPASGSLGSTPPPPSSAQGQAPFTPAGQQRRGSWRDMAASPAPSSSPQPGPRASEPAPSAAPKLSSNLSSTSIPSQGTATPPSSAKKAQASDPLLNEKILQLKISGLLNQKVVVLLKTSQKWEGLLADLDRSGPGESFGVVLKMAKDANQVHKGVQREITFPSRDVVDVRPAGGDSSGSGKPSGGREGFQTDTDISRSTPLGQERELTPWQADPSPNPASNNSLSGGRGDADTFGAPTGPNGRGWDQFAENEKRFGTRSDFDEELYTTKLDRSGKDFRERERKAEMLANQIMGVASSNPHIQEERGQAVDSSLGEEDRYSGVARSTNAYVPPGARRSGASPLPSPTPSSVLAQSMANKPPSNGTATPLAHPSPAALAPASSTIGRSSSSAGGAQNSLKAELPRAPSDDQGALRQQQQQQVPELRVPSTGSAAEETTPAGEKSALSAFHEFVKSDRQRLELKKKQMEGKVKSEKDKRLKELVRFGQDFKLKTNIPEDLVPILAKDAEKQKAIVEKAQADALLAATRASVAPPKPTTPLLPPSQQSIKSAFANRHAQFGAGGPPPPLNPAARGGKIAMSIQDIPPFNPAAKSAKPAGPSVPAGPPSPAFSTASQSTQARLNINAPAFVFKPNPAAAAFRPSLPPAAPRPPPVREIPPHHSTVTPVKSPVPIAPRQGSAHTTPQQVQSDLPPNPFFGTKPFKRSSAVNVRDDFNPHKSAKVSEAGAYQPNWPFSGRPYRYLFAPAPQDMMYPPPGPDSPYGYHPDPSLPLSLNAAMAPPHAVSPSMHHAQINPNMYPQHHGGPVHQNQFPYPYQQYRYAPHLGQPPHGSPFSSPGPGQPGPNQQQPGGAGPAAFSSPSRGGEAPGGPGGGGFVPAHLYPPQGPGMGHAGGQGGPPNMGFPPPPLQYMGQQQPGGGAGGYPNGGAPRGGYYQQVAPGGMQQSPQMGHVYPNQQQPPYGMQQQGQPGGPSQPPPPPPHFAGGPPPPTAPAGAEAH